MNNKIAKELRAILPPTDPISRRNYRRAKKNYVKLSEKARPVFLAALKDMLYASNDDLKSGSV